MEESLRSFGKYELEERLGEGGMAVVWRAKLHGPRGFEKQLVVKQVRAELAARREFVDLFVAEAKLTVALTHANIAAVYELGMVDSVYFLALELVDGPPVSELIARGPVPAPLAAYIVEQVLRGLDYAHRRGVVHRDLSPANVLVSRDGEVKIVDFGIAAPRGAAGVAGGSEGYVAPEQQAGGHADARSDLFAVGVWFAELLTGRRWSGATKVEPSALAALIATATARDPAARFADAGAMLADVARFLRATDGPTQAGLSSFVRKASRESRPRAPTGSGRQPAIPVTVPMSATGRQITFATRLAPPASRRRLLVAVGALALAPTGTAATSLRRSPSRAAPPATGTLVVRVSPVGAELVLDGKPVTAGARQLAPGRHTVAASARGRRADVRTIDLAAGERIETTLAPTLDQLRLVVRTQPPGATVTLGDRPLGKTPLETEIARTMPLPRIAIRLRDFAPVERTLLESDFVGQPIPRATVDEKLARVARGELTLGARPWAHVVIDGEKRSDTPVDRLSLTAGPHAVRLVCPPTGRELKFTVVIEPGKLARRIADLRGEPRLESE